MEEKKRGIGEVEKRGILLDNGGRKVGIFF
jgi:hypothetical protein